MHKPHVSIGVIGGSSLSSGMHAHLISTALGLTAQAGMTAEIINLDQDFSTPCEQYIHVGTSEPIRDDWRFDIPASISSPPLYREPKPEPTKFRVLNQRQRRKQKRRSN